MVIPPCKNGPAESNPPLGGEFDTLLSDQLARYGKRQQAAFHFSEPADSDGVTWKRFAAAAGVSLAAVHSVEAAVQHSHPSQPLEVLLPAQNGLTNTLDFDLDGDNQADFNFRMKLSAYATSTTSYALQLVGREGAIVGMSNNVVIGTNEDALKLAPELLISDDSPKTHRGIIRLSAFSSSNGQTYLYGEQGSWLAADNGYLGMKFNIPGSGDHFGWVLVATEKNDGIGLTGLKISEWAYQDVPGAVIDAGDRGNIAVPGDYDGNGEVELEDYLVWKTSFGTEVYPGEGADGNADGNVNAADYTHWKDNMGVTAATGSAIPEPAAATLGTLALGAVGVMALRRRTTS
jgi:hypothetical protein